MSTVRLIALSILSGLLLPVAYIWPEFYPVIFVALVPWLIAVCLAQNATRVLVCGLLVALVGDVIAYHWVITSFQSTYSTSWITAAFGGSAFFIINQVHIIAFGFLIHVLQSVFRTDLKEPRLLIMAWLAATYVFLEGLLPKLFGDTLGHGLYGSISLRQSAAIGGLAIGSFLVMATNLTIAISLIRFYAWATQRRDHGQDGLLDRQTKIRVIVLVVLFLAFAWQGHSTVETFRAEKRERTAHFTVIQGNTPAELKSRGLKNESAAQAQIADSYLIKSAQALAEFKDTDVLVWPESAYPRVYRRPGKPGDQINVAALDAKLAELARDAKIDFALGAFSADAGKSAFYNSIFILHPDGDPQIYRKNHLLPFEEYVPILGEVASFQSLIGAQNKRGLDFRLLELSAAEGAFRAIPVICYEVLFLNHIARGVNLGANMILNLSEDVWFDSSIEAQLHLRASAYASIQANLYQVRATGSGHSALIDPLGTIIDPAPHMSASTKKYEVPLRNSRATLVVMYENWFYYLTVVSFAAGALWLFRIFRQNHA